MATRKQKRIALKAKLRKAGYGASTLAGKSVLQLEQMEDRAAAGSRPVRRKTKPKTRAKVKPKSKSWTMKGGLMVMKPRSRTAVRPKSPAKRWKMPAGWRRVAVESRYGTVLHFARGTRADAIEATAQKEHIGGFWKWELDWFGDDDVRGTRVFKTSDAAMTWANSNVFAKSNPKCNPRSCRNPAHRHARWERRKKPRKGKSRGPRTALVSGPDGGRTNIQSILFSKKKYTPTTARTWLKAHGYKSSNALMDVSKGGGYIHVRQQDPNQFKGRGGAIRTITFGKGIKARVGII